MAARPLPFTVQDENEVYMSVKSNIGHLKAAALAPVRRQGAVDVLLHCAGVEISHFLAEKTQREYDLVFDVTARTD